MLMLPFKSDSSIIGVYLHKFNLAPMCEVSWTTHVIFTLCLLVRVGGTQDTDVQCTIYVMVLL